MEVYLYKCPVCNFAHQVPDYWVSFVKEPTIEYEHMSFQTGEMCENTVLNLKEDE
ncbi:hypothetical protein C8E03_11333 [Lachnotalea glycerini]|jgi:hypothetical protein|uniref:Uncharacterized protein n=1 Tax=Lachnotalea glycerini TaxID=1763509 RepID=A0A318EHU1_9FIRM|nr:hypothetical protein [Lachnotalea glycerini]PXV86248.1 hypothetical protein C8E03_11333 [Lachnotalea glycerini]